jgi:hypothetical protein
MQLILLQYDLCFHFFVGSILPVIEVSVLPDDGLFNPQCVVFSENI